MKEYTEVQVGTVLVLPAAERSPRPDSGSQDVPNQLEKA